MKKTYPVRTLEIIEVRSPNGIKRIEMYTQFSDIDEEISDEVLKELGDQHIPDFIDPIIYEGTTHILVDMGGQTVPQPFKFKIQDVKTIQEAIDKFDESANKAFEEYKAEREKVENQIVTASSLEMPNFNDTEDNPNILLS